MSSHEQATKFVRLLITLYQYVCVRARECYGLSNIGETQIKKLYSNEIKTVTSRGNDDDMILVLSTYRSVTITPKSLQKSKLIP